MAEVKPASTADQSTARASTADNAKERHEQRAEAAKAAADRSDEEKKKIVEATEKRHNVKPTPTQRECDLAALGQSVLNKEDDGSGPDPFATRHLEGKPANSTGGYATRESRPASSSSPSPSSSSSHRSHSSSGA